MGQVSYGFPGLDSAEQRQELVDQKAFESHVKSLLGKLISDYEQL